MQMPELINGRTSEDIKAALRFHGVCEYSSCTGCSYGTWDVMDCVERMSADALVMIERLEADREALLKIAHDYAGCSECIHMDNKPELPPCSDCGVLGKNWVWRGAGKEQTNENA